MNRRHGLVRNGHRPWARPTFGILVALGALALLVSEVPVWGGDLSGQVSGKGGFQSGTMLLSDAIGGSNALSSPNSAASITTNQGACSTYPLSTDIGSPSDTTLGNQGSISPTAASLATTGSCGVQEFVDASTAGTDTGLAVGGITYGESVGGIASSVGFDGSTGWGETLTSSAGTANYSLLAWVNPSALNGVIIGDTNVQSDSAPIDTDRMLWINSAGRIGFGNDATTLESTAGAALSTGNWTFIVATKSATAGMVIYINGVANATATTPGAKATLSYTGFWHLGWGSALGSTFTTLPTGNFFNGLLADAAVFTSPTVLSASQVSSLYLLKTQATLAPGILADAPTSYWPLQDTGAALYSGAIANLAANPAAQYGDYSANPGTNYGIGQGTLGSDASGPIATTATTFNGSTGYIETNTDLASPGPETFSIAAWFKTSTSSGSIIGLANLQSDATQSEYDRMLWIDSGGHVVFGIYSPTIGIFEVKSPASYANGAWHSVVITVSPVTATTATVLMYIDGALVGGAAGNEAISGGQPASPAPGYWHLGWAYDSSWTDGPSNSFWNGSLGQIAVFATALTPANVSTLYAEPSAGSYASAVTGGVAASNAYWPLSASAAPSSPACSYIVLSIQAGSGGGATCLYPASVVACTAMIPPGSWLSPVSATIPVALPVLTFATAIPSGSTVPATGAGLHVSVPLMISDSAGGFSASLVHNLGYVLL